MFLISQYATKVIYTQKNLQLSAASLFRYAWHFCGHNVLKVKKDSTWQIFI